MVNSQNNIIRSSDDKGLLEILEETNVINIIKNNRLRWARYTRGNEHAIKVLNTETGGKMLA
jgi:hypothetical protein